MEIQYPNTNLLPGLKELRNETSGDRSITIAVLDGPCDLSHPCFDENRVNQSEIFFSSDSENSPALEHGTSVASIIFGKPGSPVEGIAPGCSGIIIPVFKSSSGSGKVTCSQLDLTRAITEAVSKGANIINISGGEFSPSGEADTLLSDTISRYSDAGILFIAAAGNDGCECLHIPASVPKVLAAGAMNREGNALEFSNWGGIYMKNGLLFPGENILCAVPGGGAAYKSGTSFASAVASGIAGLLMSVMLKSGKSPGGDKVFEALLKNASGCENINAGECKRNLAGKINIEETLSGLIGSNIEQSDNSKSYFLYKINISNNYKQEGEKVPEIIQEGNIIPSEQSTTVVSSETENHVPESTAEISEVTAQDCGCGCGGKKKSCGSAGHVYAIGSLSYGFKTEANRDALKQFIDGNPEDPAILLSHLDQDPEASDDVTWILNIDSTPIYAIIPSGGYAPYVYDKLRDFLREQLNRNVQRVSIPGFLAGSVRLMSGQVVPAIVPQSYGMYSWSTSALVEAVIGKEPAEQGMLAEYSSKKEGVSNFLDRVYYELRNLGVTSQERAINFAATNAFQIETVFRHAASELMQLDDITVEKSPVCRPDSDCWDVKLMFFNPSKRMEQARRVYRFTIDVSHVIPVTVGEVRSWYVF